MYDPKGSSSAKTVGCNDGFCKSTFDAPGSKSDECKVGMLCAYAVTYGDGSSTAGFFVNDIVKLAQVSGNRQTKYMSGNVTFGWVLVSSWVFMFFMTVSISELYGLCFIPNGCIKNCLIGNESNILMHKTSQVTLY